MKNMVVHTTGPYSIAVHLPPEEIEKKGKIEIDDEWARRLALGVMDEFGIGAQGKVEIEAFAGRGGLMIFAALCPESRWETLFFCFDRLEDVLELSERLRPRIPPKSTLTYIDGEYILSLTAPPEEIIRLGLLAGEFGRRLFRPGSFARFLAEHGREVIARTALRDLLKVA